MIKGDRLVDAYPSYYGAEDIGIVGKCLPPITTLSINCKSLQRKSNK